jgi:L-aminopeptidase/D-esterase-like protein
MARSPVTAEPVQGLRIGHAETERGETGVTAVLFDRPAPTVVDHRGGASATYDIGSLGLDATFGRRWAVFFAGGSLYGLDAAAGVRQQILAEGGGMPVFRNPNRVVPISGAALFDLPPREQGLPDYRALGYEAARRAASGPVAVGRVGAGAGATVGKYHGRATAMYGGLGWSSAPLGQGRLGVLIAVNSVGGLRDPETGRWVAGARGPGGRILAPSVAAAEGSEETSTTLSLVVTDLEVDRPVLQRVASIAHASLGGVIVPFHSATDGDVMFAAATGAAGAPPPEERPGGTADWVGIRAAACAAEAALVAVRAANPRG